VKGEPCKFVAGHSARVHRRQIVDGAKQCPRCSEWKPLADFNRAATRADGHDVYCRDCMSEKHRRYNAENRERRTAKAREFRAQRPDYQRQNVARWRERNYEHHLAQARIYAAARRARLRDQFVEDVDAFVVYDRDGGVCGICGDPVSREGFHVDHINPLALGGEHSYANVQVAHPSCNSRKRDRYAG
jgi:5-methylcytosine-specific restriction endonuclease McrA